MYHIFLAFYKLIYNFKALNRLVEGQRVLNA